MIAEITRAPAPRILALGLVIAMVTAACAVSNDVPPLERRAYKLNRTIMCPICPGESIDQAQNTLANQMRGIVMEKLEQGWSDDEIRTFFVDRYGPSVLLEPPREGFGLVAWILPPVSLLVAIVAFLFAIRWMRRSPPTQPEAYEKTADLSEEELEKYYARIEAALERADGNVTSVGDAQSKGAG